jgi:hypothetical protein
LLSVLASVAAAAAVAVVVAAAAIVIVASTATVSAAVIVIAAVTNAIAVAIVTAVSPLQTLTLPPMLPQPLPLLPASGGIHCRHHHHDWRFHRCRRCFMVDCCISCHCLCF